MPDAGGPRRSLGTAVVALTGARLASVGASFLAGVVAARLLDPAALGAGGVGLTLAWAVAIVANGGLNIAAIYFLGRRPAERRAVVGYVVSLALGALAAAAVCTGLAAPFVGALVLDGPAPSLFVAAGVLAAATIAYEITGSLLLGLERRRAYVLADVLRSVATLGLTVALLGLVSRTAAGYVCATGLGVAVPALVALVAVRRAVGSVRPRFSRPFTREALRMGLAGQVGNVLTFLNLRLDLMLVPALLRLDLAGVYFVATRVSEVVGQASTAAASMLFPHVAAQPDARATATTERTSRLTLLATVGAAAALAVVSPLLLGWVFGPAYRAGVPALLVLLAAMPPLALARVLAADLKGRGRPGLVSVGSGVGVALTVVGDVALIPVLGIEGAALASVVAYTGMAAVLVGCYRRVTGGSLLALLPRFSDLGDVVRLGRARRSDVSAAEGRMSGPAPVAGTNPTRPTEGDAVPADDDVRSLR